jgi:hypothetical protein
LSLPQPPSLKFSCQNPIGGAPASAHSGPDMACLHARHSRCRQPPSLLSLLLSKKNYCLSWTSMLHQTPPPPSAISRGSLHRLARIPAPTLSSRIYQAHGSPHHAPAMLPGVEAIREEVVARLPACTRARELGPPTANHMWAFF